LTFFNELKRRNVIRVGIAYVIAAWLILQIVGVLQDILTLPEWLGKVVLVLLIVSLPLALIFAWAFELTPDGVKRESEVDRAASIRPKTGKKLDRVIIGVLIVVLVYIGFDKLVLEPSQDAELVEATRQAVAEEGVEQLVESAAAEDIDRSIAVLPFVNMSDDAGNEYFSHGISEELLNLLTKVPQLKVIARTSSFSFKGKEVPIAEIAKTLNVAHVLEGSVRKSGDRVRITAQLIRASDSTQLWSESYDRTLEDIFATQDEIAETVVAQLKVKLLGEVPKVQETDPEAYALLLQARQVWNQGTREAFEQSIALIHKALAIDSESSLAWGELAWAFAFHVALNSELFEATAAQARDAAMRALAIDPDSAVAEAALGEVARYVDRDQAAAALHYERALALEPANTSILRSAGHLATYMRRIDEGIAIYEFVVSRDPVSPQGHLSLGWAYMDAERLDEAIASMRTTLTLSPEFFLAQLGIGFALLKKGKPHAALEAFERVSEEQNRLFGLAHVYHALHDAAESDAALAELITKYEWREPAKIAEVLAYRGEYDRAFEWFEKAVQYQDPHLMRITLDAKDLPIQDDPRWLPFLESIGMSPAQLDAIEFNVTLPE
jgi:adenylate cyclase